MIAIPKRRRSEDSVPTWQTKFVNELLPGIVAHARNSFRRLPPEARDEAVQAVVCNACAATARLAELGKLDLAHAGPLARFGVAQVNDGRMTGGHLNCKDIASRYCQRKKNLRVERLDHYDAEGECWLEAVVEDPHTPVFDQVQFRCDFPAWLKSLTRRSRRIAEALSLGHCTGVVAKRFRVSAGRVSQIRRELHESWAQFLGEQTNIKTGFDESSPHATHLRHLSAMAEQPSTGKQKPSRSLSTPTETALL